mgnify:CR=1 FL=1
MSAAEPNAPLRVQIPVYGVGLFSNSMTDVGSVILPIWLASLGATPATIGLVVGSRHILPFLFAIHGGALMDRLGVKLLTSICAATSGLIILTLPLQTALPVIVIMQMINGYGSAMGWIGAQAAFGRLLKSNPTYSGRFAFGLRVGSFIGPPIIGFAWDHIGIWGGFAGFAFWSFGTFICTLLLPDMPGSRQKVQTPMRLRDFAPRLSDYREAWRLARGPVMAVVLIVTLLRVGASSVQDSFYPVYLQSIGFSATLIGLLVTITSAVAAFSSLSVGFFTRLVSPVWLLIITGMGSIIFVSITPFQDNFIALAIVAICRGMCMGISQPLMLSILANASGAGSLGVAAALRTTANRLSAGLTPIAMGYVAHIFGLTESFLIIGGILLFGLLLVAGKVWRNPHLAKEDAGA